MDSIRMMRSQLSEIAEREAISLWRIARTAAAKGCSRELVSQLREEGFLLYSTCRAYPERLLDGYYLSKNFKFAFKMANRKEVYYD